jgi:hypothetical protein
MSSKTLSFIAVGLTLGAFPLAHAQDDAAAGEQSAGPMEEVIVTGQRTLRSLINEAARETEAFYARLNEVLDNEDFEIRCRLEYPAGTNIATKVCRMRYQEELESRRALSQIQGLGQSDSGELVFNGIEYDIVPEAMRMQEQFEEEVLQAVNTDVELNQSVVRLMQLKAAVENYETPREERRRERDDGATD